MPSEPHSPQQKLTAGELGVSPHSEGWKPKLHHLSATAQDSADLEHRTGVQTQVSTRRLPEEQETSETRGELGWAVPILQPEEDLSQIRDSLIQDLKD